MAFKKRAQTSFEDKVVDNPEIESDLETRDDLNEQVKEFRKIDKEVKAKIAAIATPRPYRIGRFVIEDRETKGRHVEFDSEDSSRISIKAADE